MLSKDSKYVIGVDGGGTKTTAALADLQGNILKTGKSGSASLRNIGIKSAMKNIGLAIEQVLKNQRNIKISSTVIGSPSLNIKSIFKDEDIKKELLKNKKILSISKSKIILKGDQIVSYRSGTDEKDGVLLIAGTGCVACGWKDGKSSRVSGWGWLADEGSAFWVGQETFKILLRGFDGRGQKTILAKNIFQKLRIKTAADFINLVYSKNPTEIIPLFSIFCDEAAKGGDKAAQNILIRGGKELSLAACGVIKQLNFQKEKFPVVLIGGMFKSKIILDIVKRGTKQIAPKAEIILPGKDPVIGAVKLAIESIK